MLNRLACQSSPKKINPNTDGNYHAKGDGMADSPVAIYKDEPLHPNVTYRNAAS